MSAYRQAPAQPSRAPRAPWWRADVDAVDNVRVYVDEEQLFVGFMAAGAICFWEMPDGYDDDAVSALEVALRVY